jgi:hypothetical protein
MPKTGRLLEFRPPGVVKIFVVGLAIKHITTIIPAALTHPNRLKNSASVITNRSIKTMISRAGFGSFKAAGNELRRRK